MEVAVTAITLITFFCGRSICCDSNPKLKLNRSQVKELDNMVNDYMEYVAMENQYHHAPYEQLQQRRYR